MAGGVLSLGSLDEVRVDVRRSPGATLFSVLREVLSGISRGVPTPCATRCRPVRWSSGRSTSTCPPSGAPSSGPAGPDDGEEEEALHAMAALDAHGHPYEIMQVAARGVRGIKIRRKGRGRGADGESDHIGLSSWQCGGATTSKVKRTRQ
ncbi:hypothetical protein ACTMTI_52840 [Nonomuraea sp. H19]|uniref:hypothetical protein n=1 Tax=Nonomuraea sp. H19 TaxID=3452206 RepID=UPI003F88EC83